MKRGFFLVLLVLSSSMTIHPEARSITLETGESGFFLSREDMEVAVMKAEDLELLERDYEAVGGFYADQLKISMKLYIENNKLEGKNRKLKILCWIFGGATAFLGFLLGMLIQ